MGGIGIWQLIIIAVIIVLLFGTKKLRNLGGDLGSAIKGFKSAVSEEDKPQAEKEVAAAKDDALANKATTQESATIKEKDQV